MKKRINCDGVWEPQIYFVVRENLRQQVLSKTLNAARPR